MHKDTAQDPHFLELAFLDQQFFLTRAGLADIKRWEDTLIRDLTIEHDFGVAGTLELFENNFVHTAAGIYQRGRDDGQGTTFFDVPGRAEEALWTLQRVRIHTAGQHLAR